MTTVRFTKKYADYKKNEVALLRSSEAKQLVKLGVAEKVD